MHGIFVMFGDSFKTHYKWLNRIGTFIIVSILWSFFIWSDTFTAVKMIASIFTNFNITDVMGNILNLGLTLSDWIVLSIFTLILFIYDGNKTKIELITRNISPELKIVFLCTTILLILVFGIYGIGFNVNEFIYSNF
jgi:hypothetical protein